MHTNKLQVFADDRGFLHPLEFKDVPFQPKRCFIISGVPKGTTRGNHAHHETEQYLICLQGQVTVVIINNKEEYRVNLNKMDTIYIPKLCWDYQVFNTENDLLLVLASTEYKSDDYINDFSKFELLVNGKKHE